MERKSLWKNFLLLTAGSLLALHMNVQVAERSDTGSADTTVQFTSHK